MTKWYSSLFVSALIVFGTSVQAHEHGGHDHAVEEEHEATIYEIDPAHSIIGFSIRHLGIVNIRGSFTEYEGELLLTNGETHSLVLNATIDVASVDTGNTSRDDHLRSADYFEVETLPEIIFKSAGVVPHNGGYALVGDLTIKDVTQEVTLPLTVSDPVEDPWGNTRIGIELGGTINRHDFGVANDALADRSLGNTVTFDIQIQAIRQ